ncbi:fibronectin type III-like domain-contianing protein [Paenibacillus sp. CAU 1782]
MSLKPGESKRVTAALDTETFCYYNTLIGDWHAASGTYDILVGPSSVSCPLHTSLELVGPHRPQPDLRAAAPGYYDLAAGPFVIRRSEFEALYGEALPEHDGAISRPYTACHTLEDVGHTWIGRIILMYADRLASQVTKSQEDQKGMILSMMREMPFYAMVASGDGMLTEQKMEGLLDLLNGNYARGIRKLIFPKR